MTDVKAPSPAAFVPYPIGHAPVTGPVRSHIASVERLSKPEDVKKETAIESKREAEEHDETAEEPKKSAGDGKAGAGKDAVDPAKTETPALDAGGANAVADEAVADVAAPEPAASTDSDPSEAAAEKVPVDAPKAEDAAVGDKRKAETEEPEEPAVDLTTKKAKTDKASNTGRAKQGKQDNKDNKAKKDNKKKAPPVGQTARKTRSQGPVDA